MTRLTSGRACFCIRRISHTSPGRACLAEPQESFILVVFILLLYADINRLSALITSVGVQAIKGICP